jgi:predicted DNA-binding protein with PD1-like motif
MDYQIVNGGYWVRLYRDEKVNEALLNFIKEKEIPSGVISGIGAVEKVTLGYFDRDKKEYLRREFNDIYEVVSFNGNISYVKGAPFVHAHIILGDINFGTIGGHFFEGSVAVTMEIFVRVFEDKIHRELDDDLQLNLLKLG